MEDVPLDVPASSAQKESLGDRMKKYEKAMEQTLIPELPVVARLGRAETLFFHTL